MRVRLARVMAVLLSVVLLGSSMLSETKTALAQDDPSARAMLYSYYNAINVKNYQAAYPLLVTKQTYAEYAAGFATTDHITPYFGELQLPTPNSSLSLQTAEMPAVLLGYHTDNTIVSYYGCFALGTGQPNGSGWRIVGSDFKLLSDRLVPDSDTIAAYLGVNCYNPAYSFRGNLVDITQNKAFAMLTAYYRLINLRDYSDAYAMWLQPIPGPKPNGAPPADYRLPYEGFVGGYSNTIYITIYMDSFYNESGAFAGHPYVDGMEPAVLIGQHTDGSIVSYYGCYAIGILRPDELGIISGTFIQLDKGTVPTGQTILSLLKTDCTRLNLQF